MKSILLTAAMVVYQIAAWAIAIDKQATSCEIVPQSNIQVSKTTQGAFVKVVKGENIVFKIDDPQIGEIYFKINANRRFFNFNTLNLNQLNIIAIDGNGKELPVSGSVSGFKIIDGFWKLDLALDIEGKKIDFSERIGVTNPTSSNF